MVTCKNCNKEFEKDTQLRGHRMRCRGIIKEEVAKEELKEPIKEGKKIYKTDKYMELPPPIVDWLKINFGNWLDHFEVGKTEWRKDFGGYALYVKVPEEYSTEWRHEQREKYDNRTKRPMVDENGNPMRFDFVTEDIRFIPLQLEIPKIIQLLERMKDHIISNAYKKGVRLPGIGGEIENIKTLEGYKESLYK